MTTGIPVSQDPAKLALAVTLAPATGFIIVIVGAIESLSTVTLASEIFPEESVCLTEIVFMPSPLESVTVLEYAPAVHTTLLGAAKPTPLNATLILLSQEPVTRVEPETAELDKGFVIVNSGGITR